MAALSRTITEQVKLRETTYKFGLPKISIVEKMKIKDGAEGTAGPQKIFTLQNPYYVRTKPKQFDAVSVKKGNQFKGHEAPQTKIISVTGDSRVKKLAYPNNRGSYDVGGPGPAHKYTAAEGQKVGVVTIPNVVMGHTAAITVTKKLNPLINNRWQSNP